MHEQHTPSCAACRALRHQARLLVHCPSAHRAGDARSLVQKARSEAAEFRFKYGYDMPVHYLARVLADQAQVYTQVGQWSALC